MSAQEKFDALTLSGGASKGIIQLGVLHYYHEQSLIDFLHIKEYSGASIGSMICLLLICGYSPLDLMKEVYLFDDEEVISIKHINSIEQIVKKMGIMDISIVMIHVERLVMDKFGLIPTMKGLYELTGCKLSISGTNVTKMREVKYSHSSSPGMSCIEAVKISCNIPIIFQKIKYTPNTESGEGSDTMVDGGILNNFPIDYISRHRKNVLGIVVRGNDFGVSDDSFIGYFGRLTIIPQNILTDLRCKHVLGNVKMITVNWISNQDIPTIQLDSNQKMKMFMRGYEEAKRVEHSKDIYVEGWTMDEYEGISNIRGDSSSDCDIQGDWNW